MSAGGLSDMYTVLYTLYRLEGMERQEFIDYWIDIHAPIAAAIPGVRSLEIFPVKEGETDLGEQIDGFVVLRFDSREDFEAAKSSSEYQRSVEDTRLFVRHLSFHAVDSYTQALRSPAAGGH